ncbi:MAG: ATP synthase F1 subunit gamma [Ignavibacteriae bacterium]|nr:ATP synthase F1 subunit gamma [Ignavibacteriota bacterium]
MPTLREVRSRIVGVKKTQKITRAMKMVAAAKLRRAQGAVIAARPYARGMKALLQHLLPSMEPGTEPLLTARPVKTLAVVVITSDRGMCGAFNTNIMRAAQAHMASAMPDFRTSKSARLFLLGKKGSDFFSKQQLPIIEKHPGFFSHLNSGEAAAIVRRLIDLYLRGEVDRVDLVFNEFKSVAQQRVVIEQFLPMVPEAAPVAGSAHRSVDYIYEPSQKDILSALLPRYLNFTFWKALLESNAAEQGARMSAMENATENAREMIETLQLQYNKARQAAITKELLEVVSGAEAQKA